MLFSPFLLVYHASSCNFTYRREALYIWKQRLGCEATYQKLINIFEHAGYCNYAEIVKSIIICDAESEEDDSSDYEEPIPQPETYPHLKPSPLSSPKFTNRKMSLCDEYLLINPDNAQDLPEGQNYIPYNITGIIILTISQHTVVFVFSSGDVYSQKVLDSHRVSVIPGLSSKHKVGELIESYIIYC